MAENSEAKRVINVVETKLALLRKKKGKIRAHLHLLNSEIEQLKITLNKKLAEKERYKQRLQMLCVPAPGSYETITDSFDQPASRGPVTSTSNCK